MPATCPGLANLDRKWYNTYDTSGGDTSSWYGYGAEFKLDVGLYRLDQQVACQRYRHTFLIAEKVSDAKATVADLLSRSRFTLESQNAYALAA